MNKDTKIIKFICNLIVGLSLFWTLGLVGGLETETITVSQFDEYAVIGITLLWVALYVSNKMEKIERGRHGC